MKFELKKESGLGRTMIREFKEQPKPCPHCGGTDLVIKYRKGLEYCNNFNVVCNFNEGGCGASGGHRRTEAEAIEAWNRRAGDSDGQM